MLFQIPIKRFPTTYKRLSRQLFKQLKTNLNLKVKFGCLDMLDKPGQIFEKWSKVQIKTVLLGSEYMLYMESFFYFGNIGESINDSKDDQEMYQKRTDIDSLFIKSSHGTDTYICMFT